MCFGILFVGFVQNHLKFSWKYLFYTDFLYYAELVWINVYWELKFCIKTWMDGMKHNSKCVIISHTQYSGNKNRNYYTSEIMRMQSIFVTVVIWVHCPVMLVQMIPIVWETSINLRFSIFSISGPDMFLDVLRTFFIKRWTFF